MDDEIKSKLRADLDVLPTEIECYQDLFNNKLKPVIKLKFLSHLVTSIEDIINENIKKDLKLLETKTIRLFSILLIPSNIFRRIAHTVFFKYGAIIYYNASLDKKLIRIPIAHELGHIVNKKLLKVNDDERLANLFSFIAINNKNIFYKKECKDYHFYSDIEILNEIKNVCKNI